MADATALTNLDTAIERVTALLSDLCENPKPDYSVGGQSFSWSSYFQMLNGQLEALMKNRVTLAGPVEYRTTAVT